MDSKSVAVFARHPSPGKVKTRLAASIGDPAACDFYRLCSESVLQELVKCKDTVVNLFVAEAKETEKVEKWMEDIGLGIKVMSQLQSDNLGDRIFHSLKQLKLSGFAKASYFFNTSSAYCNQVAAVATDIPDIAHEIIERGLALLDTYDVVMGPALDGGFYFLGVKEISKELFDNVEWSTSTVFDKMVSNVAQENLSLAPVQCLPVIADIDTYEDLQKWVKSDIRDEKSEIESIVCQAMDQLRQK